MRKQGIWVTYIFNTCIKKFFVVPLWNCRLQIVRGGKGSRNVNRRLPVGQITMKPTDTDTEKSKVVSLWSSRLCRTMQNNFLNQIKRNSLPSGSHRR